MGESLTYLGPADAMQKYVCNECEEVFEDEPGPTYECGNCSNEWHREETESNKCPDCGKFGSKQYEQACPNCLQEVEQETVYEVDGTYISLSNLPVLPPAHSG